jgi:CRISPR-associated endonuclease Cas1
MAATKNAYQLLQSHNSVVPRSGVLTLYGYGIRVNVERGHLLLEDGVGTDRRTFRLSRVGHGLKRLVIIGADGFVSLAAIRWLADQETAFAMLERNGKVLCVTGPVRPSDARLRRAQSLAHQCGTALEIARELINQKLAGQERVARHKLLVTECANTISDYRTQLTTAETMERIRLIESLAAGCYWSAWHNLPINFPKKDQPRLPDHWQKFGTRVSPLTGSPRVAVNPANAVLNYLYCVLESESRLAAASLGLDVGLGVLHVDAPARDSLASDLMEPVRPEIDAFVLDWIIRDTLKREWFFEQRDGNCRLMSALAIRLAETATTWGRAVGPIAEWLAQTLWTSIRKPTDRERNLPTRLTQRRRTEGRGKEFVLHPEPAPQPSKICAACGVATRRGRHCQKCGREISKDKLIELAKIGREVAQSPESRKKVSDTQRRHEAAKRAWKASPKPTWPDERAYVRDIQPRFFAVAISRLSSALGVSESYAADIRAGRRRPHPRHWQALAQLVGIRRSGSSASP